jgi:hypothetical protein
MTIDTVLLAIAKLAKPKAPISTADFFILIRL